MLGILRATGTDDTSCSAQQQAQQLGRDNLLTCAGQCDDKTPPERNDDVDTESPKPLRVADLSDEVRDDAKQDDSSRGGTRTRTGDYSHRILNPVRLPIPPLGRVIHRNDLTRKS